MNPNHVGIIMDGNGRWATERGLERFEGHKRGLETLKSTVDLALKHNIPHISFFVFSTENFFRPAKEVNFLMDLLKQAFFSYIDECVSRGIKIKVVGNLSLLEDDIQRLCKTAEEKTKYCNNLKAYFAVAYGGRREIVDAVNKILASQVKSVSEESFRQYLYCPEMPDIDLLIRTGKEKRISNYFLWQIQYSEIFFSEKYWPDFDEYELVNAINFFKTRERRFGRVMENFANVKN